MKSSLLNEEKLNDSLVSRVLESEIYSKRFDSFNKSDFEVLMFTVYLDCLEGKPRDYDISIDLGITENKVRLLRVKSQLQYPREIKWQDEVISAVQHGTYDSVQKMITITLENPSVRNMIRNEIESNFGTVNVSLNSKQLVLPVESFLILAACAEQDTDEVIRKLNSSFRKGGASSIEKGNFKTRFLLGVNNVGAALASIASIYSIGAPLVEAVRNLVS